MEIHRITVGEIQTNCYLLVCAGELAVIDPGGNAEAILAKTKETGAVPKFVINTHYHFDHTLADREIREKLNAPILIHEADKDYLGFPADRYLKDGEEIAIGDCVLKVVSTPGHTKGSICLFGQGYVISGDTFFEIGVGRTDLSGGSAEDLAASLKKLAGLIKTGTTVYPGHGEIFTFRNYGL